MVQPNPDLDLVVTLTGDDKEANNVTIAFTIGLEALKSGKSVEILLLSYAVYLSENGYADRIDIGAPFRPIKDLLPEFLAAGGVVSVCKACMIHNKVDETKLLPGIKVVDAPYVANVLFAAKRSLQLN